MRDRRWVALLVVFSAAVTAACSRSAPRFSLDNARAHVEMLAGTIGSRPTGTPENARARQYIVDQLRLYGFDVRVQETDARRAEIGRTAHVSNIIGIRSGTDRAAIGLMSHADSAADAPGAADDGLGVAVTLEAARVLGARTDRRHTLMVLVTDGEEDGLMGAAGLTADREVMDRLQVYVNVEAIGSSGNAMLFETGPGNSWIVRPWASAAPHPRGASFAIEIYHRLPNDTDFSILKRHDIPGLNFAPIGDSYAYHTARDTADRLSPRTLQATGENVVETIERLDPMELGQRSSADATFFDIGETIAVTWGPVTAWVIALVALIAGVLAWFKVLAASVRLVGIWRWLGEIVWSLIGVALVAAFMIGVTLALREAREVYQPWYARPGRLFLLLLTAGLLAGWLAARLGALIPLRFRGARHPMLVWSVTLPVWLALCLGSSAVAPSAGFLWSLPLLVAGITLLAVPVTNGPVVRAVSVVVLATAATLWLRDTLELMRFVVAIMGRLPIVTPVYVYSVLALACGVMVGPPFIAATAATRPLLRPSLVTAALLVAVVIAAGLAYAAPAYTYAQPLRRQARVLVDSGATSATYEVASVEPGLDLDTSAPGGWHRVVDTPSGSVPWGRFAHPFVFRTTAAAPPVPAVVSSFAVTPVAAGSELAMTVVPQSPGLSAVFVLPAGLQPARSNLPGTIVNQHWQATFVAIPPEGITWRASFPRGKEGLLGDTRAIVISHRYPGGAGWQSLPAWLPQDHAVWSLTVAWALAPGLIAPVPPLR
jgi:hypothetical protein